MNNLNSVLVSALLLGLSWGSLSSAKNLSADESRTLVNAFKTARVNGKGNDDQTKVEFNFDVSCEQIDGSKEDPKVVGYALNTYQCNVGAGMFYGERAFTIFTVMSEIFGTSADGANVVTEAKGIECDVNLGDTNVATRFVCKTGG